MDPNGGVISITHEADGKLAVDIEALSSVLLQPELSGKPVAIISVTGALRTGKSFFLNIMLRYLREEGWKNSDWMGGEDTKADNGFDWRGGTAANTREIIMWSEPFFLKREDESEIAVLLMDTPGLFNLDSTKELYTQLFTLSMIASSVQIYNIMRMIQERDLEMLRECADVANAITCAENDSDDLPPEILFLVRDWVNVGDYPFGFEGGKSYLKSFWNDITPEVFKDIFCYLMPYPGLKAFKMENSQGDNSELDECFRQHLEILVEELLHPDKIVVKKIAGKHATSETILHRVSRHSTLLDTGNMPKIMTLEAKAKAHYDQLLQKASEKYTKLTKSLEKRIEQKKPFVDTELEEKNTEILCSATQLFNEGVAIGTKEIQKEYRIKLLKNLEYDFEKIKKRNEKLISAICTEARDTCLKNYLEQMKVRGMSNQCKTNAMEDFRDLCKQVPEKNIVENLDLLVQSINEEITKATEYASLHGRATEIKAEPEPVTPSFSETSDWLDEFDHTKVIRGYKTIQEIGQDGGYLPLAGCDVKVEDHALEKIHNITLEVFNGPGTMMRTADKVLIGPCIRLGPSGTTFSKPVCIEVVTCHIPVTGTVDVEIETKFNNERWERFQTAKLGEDGRVSFTINHFSPFRFLALLLGVKKRIASMAFVRGGLDGECQAAWAFCDSTKEARTTVLKQMLDLSNYTLAQPIQESDFADGQNIKIDLTSTSCVVIPPREITSNELMQSGKGVYRHFKIRGITPESTLNYELCKQTADGGNRKIFRSDEIPLDAHWQSRGAAVMADKIDVININQY